MKLSVVVPVFMVEQTLERCVHSLLAQNYDEMEIILVDDGSTDRCPAICDELANTHPQIRVVHQDNKGLSEARNTGIEQAQGTYITFVDSDDTIEANTLKPIMEEIESHPEYDILEYSACLFYNSPKQRQLIFQSRTYYNMQEYWLKGKAYEHTYAWNKIYKRALFDEVRFPAGKVFEDAYTLPRLLEKCNIVATTSQGTYFYYWNPQGIASTADGEKLSQLLESHVLMLNKLNNDKTVARKSLKTYYAKVLNIQLDVFEETGKEPILPEIDFGWEYSPIKLFIKKIIGLRALCKLNKTIHKVYRRSRS